jgi:hypothetical protein
MPKPTPFLASILALTLTLAGCGSGSKPDAGVQVGNAINYGSFGTTADIDCADGKSLNVGGSNNTLKVTGRCASVSIGGADNKIALQRVDGELSVVGLNNIVSYKSGDPDVDDEGSGNRISKG